MLIHIVILQIGIYNAEFCKCIFNYRTPPNPFVFFWLHYDLKILLKPHNYLGSCFKVRILTRSKLVSQGMGSRTLYLKIQLPQVIHVMWDTWSSTGGTWEEAALTDWSSRTTKTPGGTIHPCFIVSTSIHEALAQCLCSQGAYNLVGKDGSLAFKQVNT